MCGSFWFCGSVGRSSTHSMGQQALPPSWHHTWQNSFHGSRATIMSAIRREKRQVADRNGPKIDYGSHTAMPEGGLRQGKKEEAQPSNYHQNPISWISGHGRPFWIVLVQLPAFCQRLFGKLIPQKVSQTCDLKQSANPFPVRHFTQLQSPFCPFGSCCSCCLPHHWEIQTVGETAGAPAQPAKQGVHG